MSIDDRDPAQAIRAITAGAFQPWTLYDYGKVPGLDGNGGVIPDIYGLLTIERRGGVPARRSATTGRTGWRVSVRVVGRTTDEARWGMAKISDGLNEQRFTVNGVDSTPIQFETELPPELDDGRYAGLSSWTTAL